MGETMAQYFREKHKREATMTQHTPGPSKIMHQVPGLTMLACGCRAQQQEPYDGHPLRLIYVEHCPMHAAAPELLAALRDLVAELDARHRAMQQGPWVALAADLDVARAAIRKATGE